MRVEILVLFTDIFQIPRTMPGTYSKQSMLVEKREDKWLTLGHTANRGQNQGWTSGLLLLPPKSPSCYLSSSHPTDVSQPGLTGQDPVLKAIQTHLVLLTKKPSRRENRSVVISQGLGKEEELTTKLYQAIFWCDGAVCPLSWSQWWLCNCARLWKWTEVYIKMGELHCI